MFVCQHSLKSMSVYIYMDHIAGVRYLKWLERTGNHKSWNVWFCETFFLEMFLVLLNNISSETVFMAGSLGILLLTQSHLLKQAAPGGERGALRVCLPACKGQGVLNPPSVFLHFFSPELYVWETDDQITFSVDYLEPLVDKRLLF